MEPDRAWEKILGRREDIEEEMKELTSLRRKGFLKLKRLYYAIRRPVWNFYLWRIFRKHLTLDPFIGRVDCFLMNEGGLFKEYTYALCNRFRTLREAVIIVPGAGYGRFILSLAQWRPARIVAFDPIDFSAEWSLVQGLARDIFGVRADFFCGDFNKVREVCGDLLFDFVISDAVLMHVRDMRTFAIQSVNILKPGGVFHATYGPSWYGPRGDMLPWGEDEVFYHLLLEPAIYEQEVKRLLANVHVSSEYRAYFELFARERPFSFLRGREYLEILERAGLKKELLYAQIDIHTLDMLRRRRDIDETLDQRGVGKLDRCVKGYAVWMTKG